MYDGYPKSMVHLLVLPRELVQGPSQLQEEHLPMLRRLAAHVAWLVAELTVQRPELTWRHGVHTPPSLEQLHVHVLSDDFKPPGTKNMKHFKSFQPPFFTDLDATDPSQRWQ